MICKFCWQRNDPLTVGVCNHSEAASVQASNTVQAEPDAAQVQAESALDIPGDSAVAEVEEPGRMVWESGSA